MPSFYPQSSGGVMLSLQDSVFFEISIKSLLKSWSGNCEYHTLMCFIKMKCPAFCVYSPG